MQCIFHAVQFVACKNCPFEKTFINWFYTILWRFWIIKINGIETEICLFTFSKASKPFKPSWMFV